MSDDNEVAGNRYEVLGPEPVSKSSGRSWLFATLEGLLGGIVTGGSQEKTIYVEDKCTGRIVYRVAAEGVGITAAINGLSRDLMTLTVTQFRREYGIK